MKPLPLTPRLLGPGNAFILKELCLEFLVLQLTAQSFDLSLGSCQRRFDFPLTACNFQIGTLCCSASGK